MCGLYWTVCLACSSINFKQPKGETIKEKDSPSIIVQINGCPTWALWRECLKLGASWDVHFKIVLHICRKPKANNLRVCSVIVNKLVYSCMWSYMGIKFHAFVVCQHDAKSLLYIKWENATVMLINFTSFQPSWIFLYNPSKMFVLLLKKLKWCLYSLTIEYIYRTNTPHF